MTQHGIRMTFCDIELEVLQKAIAHYLHVRKRELKDGKQMPFIDSGTLRRIRVDLEKAAKRRRKVSLGERERPALVAVLKCYVDAIERETTTDVNKPFRADKELAKVICEAIDVELSRAIWTGELRDEQIKRRSAKTD
jgi:hypothetical protein